MNMQVGGEAGDGKFAFTRKTITEFNKASSLSVLSKRSKQNKYDDIPEESEDESSGPPPKQLTTRGQVKKLKGNMDIEKGG